MTGRGSFDTKRIAEGYAKDRPYLHGQVIDILKNDLGIAAPFRCGLDVGCGAGLSTRALKEICTQVTGIDISQEMIEMCRSQYIRGGEDSGYRFVCAGAEEVDAEDATYDIVSAAGVVNWVDEDRFLPVLRRIMCPAGLLFIYDFRITDRMAGDKGDTESEKRYRDWYREHYLKRFPKPPGKEKNWRQEDLPDDFMIVKQTTFELVYEFALEAFIRFMMIQSNVNARIGNHEAEEAEAKAWFYESLMPVWGKGKRRLVFDGYSWYLRLRKPCR